MITKFYNSYECKGKDDYFFKMVDMERPCRGEHVTIDGIPYYVDGINIDYNKREIYVFVKNI